jgi:hypothetical protein
VGSIVSGCGSGSGESAPRDIRLTEAGFCVPSGVEDASTGDGHVAFFVTLENVGFEDTPVTVYPVQHYTDGTSNESDAEGKTVTVPARQRYTFESGPLKYDAQNEITSCGVKLAADDVEHRVPIALE